MSLNTTVQTPSDPSAAVSGSAGQLEASQKDGLSPMTDMSSTSPAIDQTLSKPTETRIGEEIPLNEVATPAQAAADSDKASGTTETDVATRKEDDNDTVVKVEDQTPKVPAPPPMDYPDDNHFGFGWLVVFANFMILFLAAGLQYAAGSYIRAYYYSQYFGPDTTYFTVSWLGSLIGIGFPLFGPLAGSLSAYFGPRIVIIAGACFQALGLILASFATQVWQMLLSQGFMFGLGEVVVYLGCVNSIQQYFLRRRGLAIGLAVSGSGFGGLALSSVTQILIDHVGIPWSLRILGIALATIGVCCGMLLRPRITPLFQKGKQEGVRVLPKLDFTVFKNTYFLVLYISGAVSGFGYFIPFYMISSYGTSIGLSATLASLALGLMNGASAFGRIALGYIGDRLGYLNAFIICQLGTPLVVLLIWPFAYNFGVLALFGMLYGFFAGGFISILPALLHTLFGGGGGLVAMLGMQMSSGLAASLAGPPIAGAITDKNTTVNADGTKSTNWIPTIMFSGLVMLIGNMPLLWIRGDKTKWKFAVKV